MKVSVVITTYNGCKFLKEQLDSIRDQSRKADEVLILDDCSTDKTNLLVENYITENNLLGWSLISNEVNLGWKKNFKKGFDLCSGDFIFPCDQDDIWHPDKIESMIDILRRNRNVLLLSSNYSILTTNKENVESWYRNEARNQRDDGTVEHNPFDAQWFYIKRPGCTYCFNRKLLELIGDLWDTNVAHDAQLYRYATVFGGNYLYNKKLMDYRRHGDNTTASIKIGRQNRIDSIKNYISLHEKTHYWLLSDIKTINIDKKSIIRVLDRNIRALSMRKKCIEERKIYYWPVLAIRYFDTYRSIQGWLLDLIMAVRLED